MWIAISVTRQEKIWDETVNVAYLRITKFGQAGFEQAIDQGIKQGNQINTLRQGQYEFNLGCFDGNKITGQQYDEKIPYLTDAVQALLINSSAQQPTP
ncbi:MAG: hypothetical protein HC805_05815 [Alkalinema sp. RL_2_19]|nr:hypothetical protein [Alkalinema sp. RL_2_19]